MYLFFTFMKTLIVFSLFYPWWKIVIRAILRHLGKKKAWEQKQL